MEKILQDHMNISAPNLLNVCVDGHNQGEICGRIYHCYREEPVRFMNVIELLREMENLFDSIGFPQASTKTRSFKEQSVPVVTNCKPEKVRPQAMLAEYKGDLGTFVVHVKFRQNSTWQGNVILVAQQKVQTFSNTLEFIKLIDTAIEK